MYYAPRPPSRSVKIRRRLHIFRLIPCLAAVQLLLSGCPLEQTPDPPLEDDVVLSRAHLATYTAGASIDITVEIEVREGVDISAIALVEEVPSDWVYLSAENSFGILPAIRPQQGAQGTLTFVWIQPPLFPYSFTYTLGTPLSASGVAKIEGHVEYRQGAGASELTDTLQSSIAEQE